MQPTLDAARVQAHVRRVLESETFSKAHSLRRLLAYVVEETQAGRTDALKEYAIGVEVFGRGEAFDPRADTIVRVQARRLRAKLDEYYAAAGYADGLLIELPTGGYLPRFHSVGAGGRAGPRRAASLPVPRTALIGREAEVAALLSALRRRETRLLTLCGPGGSGKTRLALEVTAQAIPQFPGGVHFVGLGSVTDPADVGPALAQALGLSRVERGSVEDALRVHVRRALEARTLLVLDNFEQLLPAAPLLLGLVDATPLLAVLVTSRAVLRASGEACFALLPLPVPDLARLPSIEALARNPAVALFVRQAAARQPGFALTADAGATIAAICARLDGLPLAIELAAAWVRILSPAQILARLERRLALLVDGDRDLPARQQTLRQAIDWSHELLAPAGKRLFRRVAVFAGSWTLEAAEAVCNPRGEPDLPVLETMASLVDQSLIHPVDSTGGEPRFAMLETVREYALEQLDASGEHPLTRHAHAAYCLVIAEEGLGPRTGAERDVWLARCQREHENHRAALDHLIGLQDAEWALRLALALADYWDRRQHRLEGFARFQALLRLPALSARTKARATAVAFSSMLAPLHEAPAAMEEALSIYRELGDLRGVVGQLNNLGVNARLSGDIAGARVWLEESVRTCRLLGDRAAVASALSNLADVLRRQGHGEQARAALDEAHDLFLQMGHASGQAWSLNHLGDVARAAGDLAGARAYYGRGAGIFRGLGDAIGVARSAVDLGHVECDAGDVTAAYALFAEALEAFAAADHRAGIALALDAFACAAVVQGDRDRALTLTGAAAAVRRTEGAGGRGTSDQGPGREEPRVVALWALDDAPALARRAAGGALALDAAIACARAVSARAPATGSSPDRGAGGRRRLGLRAGQ